MEHLTIAQLFESLEALDQEANSLQKKRDEIAAVILRRIESAQPNEASGPQTDWADADLPATALIPGVGVVRGYWTLPRGRAQQATAVVQLEKCPSVL